MPTKSVIETIRTDRAKLSKFDALRKFMFRELPGWSLSVTWANGETSLSSPVFGFVNPPGQYNLRGLYILTEPGENEDDWAVEVLNQLPKLLSEIQGINDRMSEDQLRVLEGDLATMRKRNVRNVMATKAAVRSEGGVPVDAPLSPPKRVNHVKGARDRKGNVKTRHTRRTK